MVMSLTGPLYVYEYVTQYYAVWFKIILVIISIYRSKINRIKTGSQLFGPGNLYFNQPLPFCNDKI